MGDLNSRTPSTDWSLETAGKLLIATTAAAFSAGVMIANLALSPLATLESPFLDSRHVVIGAAWLLQVACACAFGYSIIFAARGGRNAFRRKAWVLVLMFPFVPVVFAVFLAAMVAQLRGHKEFIWSASTWRAAVTVGLIPALVTLAVILIRSYWKHVDSGHTDWPTVLLLELFVGGWLVIAVTLTLYANNVYPLLSHAYGGGQPIRAIIVFDTDNIRDQLLRSMLKSQATYDILAEDDDWILLRRQTASSTQIVRLTRSKVIAIIRVDVTTEP